MLKGCHDLVDVAVVPDSNVDDTLTQTGTLPQHSRDDTV